LSNHFTNTEVRKELLGYGCLGDENEDAIHK
jgi:hypothetical protein